MNIPVIVDTSGLISLVSSTDSNHSRALAASEHLVAAKRPLIVLGEVFTETVNTLGKKTGHETAASVGQRLITSGEFVLIETTTDLRTTALARFSNLPGGISFRRRKSPTFSLERTRSAVSVPPWHSICIGHNRGSPISQGAASMHYLSSTVQRYPHLIMAAKGAVVALLLLGVVLVVTPAFPLLAMVGLLWLPAD